MAQIINGDNIDVLKTFPDNHFDSVVTDPPYGLGKEPDALEVMQSWLTHGYHEVTGKGFMGKEWDAFVPQPNFWREVFRVLKPGGHVLSFFGTRTYDWGVMAMRFAGFEVRDTIQWHYGSGFPKSHNISKAIDKLHGAEREVVGSKITGTMNNKGGASVNKEGWDGGQKEVSVTAPATDEAKQWDGWGSALKPASEPIVLARKPLEKGLSIAENVLKWGTGGINIDGCRVKTDEKIENHSRGEESAISKGKYGDSKEQQTHQTEGQKLGRFPANLIMTHHPECECKGLKKVKSDGHHSGKVPEDGGVYKLGLKQLEDKGNIYAENGRETIEDWNCHPDCPIRIMDEQSGISKSNEGSKKNNKSFDNIFAFNNSFETKGHNDSGGASRFFYCAKASKSERNKGLEGFEEKPLAFSNQAKAELKRGNIEFDGGGAKGHGNKIRKLCNNHPTVKPIKLMQYLVRLITPLNGLVLDPFCGSGTTGIACRLEGFQFIGIEQDAEYCKIAEARINNYVVEDDEIVEDTEKVKKPAARQKKSENNSEISTIVKDKNPNLVAANQLKLF